nr:hypothetical protein [Nostocaceae cyanobacterium]
MLAISATLSPNQQGDAIANLHEALTRLDFGEQIPPEERNGQRYGDRTRQVVRQLQDQLNVGTNQPGIVDEATAEAINRRLFGQGIFQIIRGLVRKADGNPAVGNLLFAFDRDNIGGAYLGVANTNADGFYQIYYDPRVYTEQKPGILRIKEIIDLLVQVYDANGATIAESETISRPLREVQIDLNIREQTGERFIVRGTVKLADGSPPSRKVVVQALDKDLR